MMHTHESLVAKVNSIFVFSSIARRPSHPRRCAENLFEDLEAGRKPKVRAIQIPPISLKGKEVEMSKTLSSSPSVSLTQILSATFIRQHFEIEFYISLIII